MANLKVRIVTRPTTGKRNWLPADAKSEGPFYITYCEGSRPRYEQCGFIWDDACIAKMRKEKVLRAASFGVSLPEEAPQSTKSHRISNQIVAASTLVIALATIINLAVAIAQWRVLRNTEEQTQKSFQIDERPYVTIDGTPQFTQPPNTAGIPVSANVTFKDIGKTPAIKTVWFVDLLPYRATNRPDYLKFVENAFADLRKTRDTTVKEHSTEIGRDIAPAATTFSTENSRALSGPEMTEMSKGDGSFILLSVGIVNYSDAFGGSYETEFCYFFAGSDPRVWHICDAHNTIR